MSYYNVFDIGVRNELGSHTFTADDIIAFANKFDTQVFHVDPEAARDSFLGGHCASGWHTGAMWMQKMCAVALKHVTPGSPVTTGLSPGFDDMRFEKPVFAGDTITYFSTVTSKRPLRSRPGWGVVLSDNEGINQAGECVFRFKGTVMVPIA